MVCIASIGLVAGLSIGSSKVCLLGGFYRQGAGSKQKPWASPLPSVNQSHYLRLLYDYLVIGCIVEAKKY